MKLWNVSYYMLKDNISFLISNNWIFEKTNFLRHFLTKCHLILSNSHLIGLLTRHFDDGFYSCCQQNVDNQERHSLSSSLFCVYARTYQLFSYILTYVYKCQDSLYSNWLRKTFSYKNVASFCILDQSKGNSGPFVLIWDYKMK